MSKRRDLVVLSAIMTAPLAAILLAQQFSGSAEITADPAPDLAAPDLVSEPAEPAPIAPEPASPTSPASPVADPEPAEPAEPAAEPTRDPSQFMLMHGDELVLHTGPDLAWSSGKIFHRAAPGEFVAWRRAAPEQLPGHLRVLAGATVTVYDADGSACVATVGAARVQFERTGDVFDVGDDVVDSDPYQPPADKAVLRAMSRDLFAGDSQEALLLARQRSQAGRPCTGLWARRSDLPAPAVFGRRELPGAEHQRLLADALTLIRARPEFTAARDTYLERLTEWDPDRAGEFDWDAVVAANFRVQRWDEIGGPRRLVSVELRETPEGCGDFFLDGFALLLEHQGDQLVVRQPGWFDLAAVTDLERDGTFEGLVTGDFGRHGLEATGPNAAAVRDEFSISFWGCPC